MRNNFKECLKYTPKISTQKEHRSSIKHIENNSMMSHKVPDNKQSIYLSTYLSIYLSIYLAVLVKCHGKTPRPARRNARSDWIRIELWFAIVSVEDLGFDYIWSIWWPRLLIIYDHYIWSIWWSYMIILYDHHMWWSYMIIIYDDLIWWSNMMIIYDNHIWWPYMTIIYDDHIWWSYMIIIYEDHIRWSCMMII